MASSGWPVVNLVYVPLLIVAVVAVWPRRAAKVTLASRTARS
jgi:hypothetical protein